MIKVILEPQKNGTRGFKINFANGNSVTVMTGSKAKCDNSFMTPDREELHNHRWSCTDAEVWLDIKRLPSFIMPFHAIPDVPPDLLSKIMSICCKYEGIIAYRGVLNAYHEHTINPGGTNDK